jgi:hypothetical protein
VKAATIAYLFNPDNDWSSTKALGLVIPETLVVTADEVVE